MAVDERRTLSPDAPEFTPVGPSGAAPSRCRGWPVKAPAQRGGRGGALQSVVEKRQPHLRNSYADYASPPPARSRSCGGWSRPWAVVFQGPPGLVAFPGSRPACTGGPGSIACPIHREPAQRCRPRPGTRPSASPPLPDRRPSWPLPRTKPFVESRILPPVDPGGVVARVPLAAVAAGPCRPSATCPTEPVTGGRPYWQFADAGKRPC